MTNLNNDNNFRCKHGCVNSTHKILQLADWKNFAFLEFKEEINRNSWNIKQLYTNIIQHTKIGEDKITIFQCNNCGKFTIKIDSNFVYPETHLDIDDPNENLPQKSIEYYKEAKSIAVKSPKSACLLLRLSLEVFIKERLGLEKVDNLYKSIDDFKKKENLNDQDMIVKMLELIRKSGRDGGHYREIHITDNLESAKVIFKCMNRLAIRFIEEEKEIQELEKKFNKT